MYFSKPYLFHNSCGAGTWLLNVASIYNSSIFLGIDVCQIYPTEVSNPKILCHLPAQE